jgi:hypothetical protein
MRITVGEPLPGLGHPGICVKRAMVPSPYRSSRCSSRSTWSLIFMMSSAVKPNTGADLTASCRTGGDRRARRDRGARRTTTSSCAGCRTRERARAAGRTAGPPARVESVRALRRLGMTRPAEPVPLLRDDAPAVTRHARWPRCGATSVPRPDRSQHVAAGSSDLMVVVGTLWTVPSRPITVAAPSVAPFPSLPQ